MRTLLFLFLLLAPWTAWTSQTELTIYAEEDPPSSFLKNGKPDGFLVEIVKEIQKRTQNKDAITVVPWARAYNTALRRKNVVLLATIRTAKRESLFQWIGPIVESRGYLYALKSNPIQILSLEDAKKVQGIITVRNWYTHDYLVEQGFKNIIEVGTPLKMAEMLFTKRAPLIAFDSSTIDYIVPAAGYDRSLVREVLPLGGARTSYIAMSLGTSADVVSTWQRELDNMKKDGTFKKILEHWTNESGVKLVE